MHWAKRYDCVCFLDRSRHPHPEDSLFAVDSLTEIVVQEGTDGFEELKHYYNQHKDWLFGYLSYDLKNEIEDLESNNPDFVGLPLLHFFQPRFLFQIGPKQITVSYPTDLYAPTEIDAIFDDIRHHETVPPVAPPALKVHPRISKEKYLTTIAQLKKHIHEGDIYEINFCQEFFAKNAPIEPTSTYERLFEISPTPFSCYYRKDHHHLMCGSPERFLRKRGNTILSQPIKGTAPRGKTKAEDHALREALRHSKKDRSENVMIVDLVRNDLSRTAKKGTVQVDELFGIYTFPQVHQMISTVSSQLREDIHFIDAIKAAFPMGSMTGAPKIRAMELIETYESSKRGLYSGSVGYISPEGDFDLNVVIRSILYNAVDEYLSFIVGGAIIDQSNAESEYEECLLKASAILKTLQVEAFEESA